MVHGRLLNVGWASDADLEYSQRALLCWRLGAFSRCSNWWVGDWLRYRSSGYGERYVRASTLTGYDAQNLRNMAYVASRCAGGSRRRDSRSWTHHAEVAAPPADNQDRWLARALELRLLVSDLRSAPRLERPASGRTEVDAATRHEHEGVHTCPSCSHRWAASGLVKDRRAHCRMSGRDSAPEFDHATRASKKPAARGSKEAGDVR